MHSDRRLRRFSFRLSALPGMLYHDLSCHFESDSHYVIPWLFTEGFLSLIYQLIDLCHRKQKKMTGQFKGLVRATKRGAANVKQKKGKR